MKSVLFELKNALDQKPRLLPSEILERVRFRMVLRTGHQPTSKEILEATRLLRKYDPNQPRAPSGSDIGGQWVSATTSGETGIGDALAAAPQLLLSLLETCESLYDKDLAVCRANRLESCYKQATERYAACLRGSPIPPFFY